MENQAPHTLFWAIRLPQPIAMAIDDKMSGLKLWLHPKEIKACLHAPDNYHITLLHVGNRSAKEVEAIQENVPKIACDPFEICMQGIGAFSHEKIDRVIFMNMREGKKELCALAQSLEKDFPLPLNKPYDDPYAPHMTLVQKATPIAPYNPLRLLKSEFRNDQFSFEANGMTLFDSSTYKTQGFYREICTHHFGCD